MAPLIWLTFVILVVAIVAIGGFIAVRTGLWTRETSTKGPLEDEPPTRGSRTRAAQRRFERESGDRPEHVTREDPSNSRFIGS